MVKLGELMKRLLAAVSSLILVLALTTPAKSAEIKWAVYQKTLASFSGTQTELSSVQKAQIRVAVEANPEAEKFVCTGIRYFDQPMSVNIMVRKRAKAACDYAKEINPNLSTWVQSKLTQAKNYAGKVLLTVKSPIPAEADEPVENGKTQEESEAIPQPPALDPGSDGVAEKPSPSLEGLTWGSSLDPAVCKLQEDSRIRKPGDPVPNFLGQREIRGKYMGNATAFPFAPTTLPIAGEIDVAYIFLDWADLPGTQDDFDYYNEAADLFSDFYWMASEHKLKMNMLKTPHWIRVSGSYLDYVTRSQEEEAQRGEAPRKQVFYDAAIAAIDPYFDFSNIEIVLFAVPRAKSVFVGGPHEFNFDWNGVLRTSEGDVYNTATAGDFNIQRQGSGTPTWAYYVHEVGHMLGIPHQADGDVTKQFPEKWEQSPLGGWDVMAEHGGGQRTMTSWLRWLAGWLADDQVICSSKQTINDEYFALNPINRVEGKAESLVIKLSDTKAVVVESRRFDAKYDVETGNSKNGLIAYTVDATKASAQGSQRILSPRDITKYLVEKNTWPDWRELDAIFFQGDSLEIEGIRIEAYSIGTESDVVRVTNVSPPAHEIPKPNLWDLDLPNSECQIRETQNRFFNSKGFPFQSVLPSTGNVSIAIVPVDFSNAIGVGVPQEMFSDDVSELKRWADYVTGGKLKYRVDLVSQNWIRAPRGAEWYTCTDCQKGSTRDLQSRQSALQELIATADDKYDFTGTDFVYFVFPYQAEKEFGTAVYFNYKVPVQTKDGTATLTAYGEMGGSQEQVSWDRSRIWQHIVHEILHLQGFIGHGPVNGGHWNIMQNQFGASSMTSGWESFLAGWLSEDQVLCVEASQIDKDFKLSLGSIDAGSSNAQIAILKLSDEEVVVVELRTSDQYSDFEGAYSSSDRQNRLPKDPGFTAYRVSPNLPNYRDDRADQAEVEARNWWGYLRDYGNAWIGRSVTHRGLTLTKLDSETLGVAFTR